MAIPDATSSSTTTLSTLRSDKALRPFLAPSFDPADFLNATLPAWTPSRQAVPNQSRDAVSLAELTAQTQTLLSQLNAQLTRLSNNLNALTDEILRSGGRLAYEVEVLRGDTSTLSELLAQGLAEDIKKFSLPAPAPTHTPTTPRPDLQIDTGSKAQAKADAETRDPSTEAAATTSTPDYVTRLNSLAVVRDRLDSVIRVFGQATEWVVAPSEVSLKSALVTVSADDGQPSAAQLEARGKEYTDKLRSEILDLVGEQGHGLAAAVQRLDALRELAGVWRGTAEEKARLKIVDELQRLVEDRQSGRAEPAGSTGYRVGTDMVYESKR